MARLRQAVRASDHELAFRAADTVRLFGGGQCISTCGACGQRIEGYPAREGDEQPMVAPDGGVRHARCMDAQRAPTDRERQLIALKLASPNRAPAGRIVEAQHNTDALPMFAAAQQAQLL
jgi:hypothetical protein